MKKTTAKKTGSEPPKPSFPPGFLEWWKDHIHSGFVADKEGKYHWSITPRLAWNCARYQGEFSGEDRYFTKEEIAR